MFLALNVPDRVYLSICLMRYVPIWELIETQLPINMSAIDIKQYV